MCCSDRLIVSVSPNAETTDQIGMGLGMEGLGTEVILNLFLDILPKELSSLQNESYLKHFNFVRPTFFIPLICCRQPMVFFLLLLARPHGARRHCCRYASRFFVGSACSNSTGRSYRRKEDNRLSGLIWVFGSTLQCTSIVRLLLLTGSSRCL